MDRDLPAVWLTPLLTEPAVIDALGRARRPTRLVGGTADAAWQAGAIPPNPALEVLELPAVDHALHVPGDPRASLDALREITNSISQVAAGLT